VRLGVPLDTVKAARLEQLLDELQRWNRTYNLTAIRDRAAMVTHHVLDSLSIQADLRGRRIADVGTGAGFPGLPLAIMNPQRRFTLIDSNGKKIRFIEHAARQLQLSNVEALQQRVEDSRPAQPFDTVVTRALAAVPRLLELVQPLCDAHTRVLAMKGKWPQAELDQLKGPWRYPESHILNVPGIEEARCVIVLSRDVGSDAVGGDG